MTIVTSAFDLAKLRRLSTLPLHINMFSLNEWLRPWNEIRGRARRRLVVGVLLLNATVGRYIVSVGVLLPAASSMVVGVIDLALSLERLSRLQTDLVCDVSRRVSFTHHLVLLSLDVLRLVE